MIAILLSTSNDTKKILKTVLEYFSNSNIYHTYQNNKKQPTFLYVDKKFQDCTLIFQLVLSTELANFNLSALRSRHKMRLFRRY